MSTVIANTQLMRVARFYESTIGKKAIMAVTGLILFGFLIVHMLGNLQVFLGRDVMNHYAETLHGNPALLWTARTILLISVALHIWASIQLSIIKKDARPVSYVKRANVGSSWASRSMMLSGPIIAAFVVFHLLHLTTGTIHPQFVELHAYENLVTGFLVVPFALVYIVVMILIGFHLSHGVWSMFQSMGMSHPRYTPLIKRFASIFAWILVAGFISIPVAVLTRVVK
ncbi:MAG TPA: succinate dehydrogenase cytochrome b subunit [Terriglobia bacterium]|nr:succinate dehydrogenase cytochrome b subunit [Terriglobia bacterium]